MKAYANAQMQGAVLLLGRLLLSAIFIQAGIGKIGAFAKTAAGIAAHGLPFPELLTVLTIGIEVGGGLMLLLGLYARGAALVMFLWLIPVTFVYHHYWGVPPAQVAMQHANFMKNLAIMGGMLYVFVFGTGPLSITDRVPPGE